MKKVMIVAAFASALGMSTPVFADDIQDLHDRVDETWDKAESVQKEAQEMNKDTNDKMNSLQQTVYEEGLLRAESDRIVQSNSQKYTDNQLSKVNDAVQHNSDRLSAVEQWQSQIDSRVDKMGKKMSSGIAGVAAMANIPSPAVAGTTTIGAGLGHFNSQTSVAVGVSSYFDNGVSLKGSVATGHEMVVGAGIGYTW